MFCTLVAITKYFMCTLHNKCIYFFLINDYVELAGTRTEDVRRLRIERQLLPWCCCQYDCSGEESREEEEDQLICIAMEKTRGLYLIMIVWSPSPCLWYTILPCL